MVKCRWKARVRLFGSSALQSEIDVGIEDSISANL
jgi:hypothetical protein